MNPLFIPLGVVLFSIDPISQAIWFAGSFVRPRLAGVIASVAVSAVMMFAINGEAWARADYIVPYVLAAALWTWLWSLLGKRLNWKTLNLAG